MATETSISNIERVFSSNGNKSNATSRASQTNTEAGNRAPESPRSDSGNDGRETQRNGVRIGRRQDLREGTELLNDVADILNRDIEFNVTGPDGLVQARIKNSETGEEIRSIPPDEVILVQKKIDAFLGLFFDQQG